MLITLEPDEISRNSQRRLFMFFYQKKKPFSFHSTADACKNCAKYGKGFKIGTNKAYNIKIKIRLGGISKIFCFCSHANMAVSDKGISLKKKFLKKFLLNVTN